MINRTRPIRIFSKFDQTDLINRTRPIRIFSKFDQTDLINRTRPIRIFSKFDQTNLIEQKCVNLSFGFMIIKDTRHKIDDMHRGFF